MHPTLRFLTSLSLRVGAGNWQRGLSRQSGFVTDIAAFVPHAKWAQRYFHTQQVTDEWQNSQALKNPSLDPQAKQMIQKAKKDYRDPEDYPSI